MRHKIVFRADGSAKVGYGHVHRLMSLVQMLHKHFDCEFVSHDAPEFLQKEMDLIEVPLLTVPAVEYKLPDERKPGDEVLFDMDHLLTGNEIVVMDGYWFGKKYQAAIQNKGCVLVYIDDLMERGNGADVVINHSMGVSISNYSETAPGTAVYTGESYSLVNVPDQFRHHRKHEDVFSQLLISMGGADPLDFTGKIIDENGAFISRFKKTMVMVGPAYQHIKSLQQKTEGMDNVEIICAVPKTAMFHIMEQSSAAIISASTMSVEYANIGGALAVVQTADNQKYLFRGLLQSGAAVSMDKFQQLDDIMANSIITQQQKVFDGKPADRFIRLFAELQVQASFSFEKATAAHLQTTFEWAADATVRAYSFNQNPISFEEHQSWYLRKIEQPDCIYLLGKWGEEIVGSLRFDIKGTDALISYLVSPKYHGRGLGRIVLAKGLQYLALHTTTVTTATGYVMPANTASVKVFERLGFDCMEENKQLCFTKTIIRS